MFLKSLDLTAALRPSLFPDEALLFLQDAIGLYEGKYKLPDLQDGQVYLTSHRICYVDNTNPRKSSIAVELKAVDRYEFYAGFLKSSPKITLYPKLAKRISFQSLPTSTSYAYSPSASHSQNSVGSPQLRSSTPHQQLSAVVDSSKTSNATWICKICSFSNPVPISFDPTTATSNYPFSPCLACGIKPSFPHVLKAAIAGVSGKQVRPAGITPITQPLLEGQYQYSKGSDNDNKGDISRSFLPATSQHQCPRCTFLNHPSLLSCEVCGAPLLPSESTSSFKTERSSSGSQSPRPSLDWQYSTLNNDLECLKLSFRGGGEKVFYERLKGAMVQRKWLLQSAPPIPESIPHHGNEGKQLPIDGSITQTSKERTESAGIAGLEQRGLEIRKKNEAMIGSAFEDLDALMASAKEIIALAETFAKNSNNGSSTDPSQIIVESAKALDMVTTKDMLGSSAGKESLYLSELSRNLAEYLTDDRRGILKKEGGIMSLVDLWADFNQSRGGVELISPSDFEKAARLWGKLKLPVRLRQFKNGLLVVQQADRTDEKTITQLLCWLQEMRKELQPSSIDTARNLDRFGKGVTAQEAAQRFGWSVGVATEELEMAEERGVLCRENGMEGLRFWENWLAQYPEGGEDDIVLVQGWTANDDMNEVVENLKATGLL